MGPHILRCSSEGRFRSVLTVMGVPRFYRRQAASPAVPLFFNSSLLNHLNILLKIQLNHIIHKYVTIFCQLVSPQCEGASPLRLKWFLVFPWLSLHSYFTKNVMNYYNNILIVSSSVQNITFEINLFKMLRHCMKNQLPNIWHVSSSHGRTIIYMFI